MPSPQTRAQEDFMCDGFAVSHAIPIPASRQNLMA